MDLAAWNEKLSLNIARIDAQHREFIYFLARMQQAVGKRETEEAVRRTFEDLSDYARRHFRDEEDLFRAAGFPGLDLQRRQHLYFTMQVEAMQEAYFGEGKLPPESLLNFLADWLVHHILEEDKKYAAYLASRS